MVRFSKRLYISPSLDKKRRKIMWKLRTGRPQPCVYIIALAKIGIYWKFITVVYSNRNTIRKKANAPYIVGIAAGYSGAVDLVIDMVEDVYQEMEHTT